MSSRRSASRRKSLGESLLVDALARTQCITSTGSGIGLFVTAADEQAATGYQRFGCIAPPDSDHLVFLSTTARPWVTDLTLPPNCACRAATTLLSAMLEQISYGPG